MRSVEIVYRYAGGTGSPRERPVDAESARRRMNDGNRSFAALFAGIDGQTGTTRQEIPVDPRDLGLTEDGDTAPAQRPYAAVLGCADARVPIELVFNEGANDLFVVRVAGNSLGDDALASLGYALEHLADSLRLVAVLGHSRCGAVTAAVDVYLDPKAYLALSAKHRVRSLVDRLQTIVHASARRLESLLGPGIRAHPGYREALIEVAVVSNAALVARSLQQEIDARGGGGVRAAFGVYVLSERAVWAPRAGSEEVGGLATPPDSPDDFLQFSEAVVQSSRIAALLGAAAVRRVPGS